MEKKLIAISGSTGFVGKKILSEISKLNHLNIRLFLRDNVEHKNSNDFYTKDLFSESIDNLVVALSGVHTLIHLAWYVEPGKYLQSDLNLECLNGTLKLAIAAKKAGVKKIVGIGTCFEYDLTQDKLSIESVLKPTSLYAAAKLSVFNCLSEFCKDAKIDFLWCRLFYLFGDGEDERRLVPYIENQLRNNLPAELTSGNQIRDFIEVTEAAKMILDYSLNNVNGPKNICSGNGITVRQLAEKIADKYNRRDLLKFGTRPDNLVDPPCVIGIK